MFVSHNDIIRFRITIIDRMVVYEGGKVASEGGIKAVIVNNGTDLLVLGYFSKVFVTVERKKEIFVWCFIQVITQYDF
jgi:hypothetical protein